MFYAMTGRLREARWDVIPPSAHAAHVHMALDEVLLERVITGRRPPTMRLWKWIEPALVIGSHQSVLNEVDLATARETGFVVTRRMSGGGTMLCEPDRTITYSLYLPETMVADVSFRRSYAVLDAWAVHAFQELGIPAGYREINDIISPRGKIGGAAQARRRGFVLHHTTIAHTMDVTLVPRLIRIGRNRVAERGVRSAEKPVSPLAWFTDLSCDDVETHLQSHFVRELPSSTTSLTTEELEDAGRLVATKYATPGWINRLP
jgi:lipoate-protein ligase A